MIFYEMQHNDAENAQRTLAKIESLLSRENADRLALFVALRKGERAEVY